MRVSALSVPKIPSQTQIVSSKGRKRSVGYSSEQEEGSESPVGFEGPGGFGGEDELMLPETVEGSGAEGGYEGLIVGLEGFEGLDVQESEEAQHVGHRARI